MSRERESERKTGDTVFILSLQVHGPGRFHALCFLEKALPFVLLLRLLLRTSSESVIKRITWHKFSRVYFPVPPNVFHNSGELPKISIIVSLRNSSGHQSIHPSIHPSKPPPPFPFTPPSTHHPLFFPDPLPPTPPTSSAPPSKFPHTHTCSENTSPPP